MENTAKTLTCLGTPTLLEELHGLKNQGKTVTDMAEAMGISRSVLSLYMNGSYGGNIHKLEQKVQTYLGYGDDEAEPDGETAPPAPLVKRSFFETQDARSVIGVCKSCQDYEGFGIVVGRSGFGKTHTLKHYAKMPRVVYIECDDTMSSRDLVEEIERLLGIPNGGGTIRRRVNGIRDFFAATAGYLIIIDEADKLINKNTQKKMEILRGVYDQSNVGIVVAGEPRLEGQIKNWLPRLANRIDFYTTLRGLTADEIAGYFGNMAIDKDALAELANRACNQKNGCFRLLDRTLNNVFRLLEQRGEQRITLKLIHAASSMMMI